MQSMKSKFDSTCGTCKTKIKQGETIYKVNDHWCKNQKCGQNTPPTESKVDSKTNDYPSIKAKNPHEEAELLITWASNRAYKKAREGISDINSLSVQDKQAIGQKEGMLTKLYVDTLMKVIELSNVRLEY